MVTLSVTVAKCAHFNINPAPLVKHFLGLLEQALDNLIKEEFHIEAAVEPVQTPSE